MQAFYSITTKTGAAHLLDYGLNICNQAADSNSGCPNYGRSSRQLVQIAEMAPAQVWYPHLNVSKLLGRARKNNPTEYKFNLKPKRNG